MITYFYKFIIVKNKNVNKLEDQIFRNSNKTSQIYLHQSSGSLVLYFRQKNILTDIKCNCENIYKIELYLQHLNPKVFKNIIKNNNKKITKTT